MLYQGSYFIYFERANKLVGVTQVTDYVKSCIDGEFDGWTGNTVFTLCNGQVWQQSQYKSTYNYAYKPNVLIILRFVHDMAMTRRASAAVIKLTSSRR